LVDNSDLGTGVDSLASRKIGHLLGRNLSHSCQSHRDLAKQLSHYLYFFSFYFLLDLLHKEEGRSAGKCHITSVTVSHHMIKSHEEYGKIVHRPCSSCTSSVQEINENSIEFSLSTGTWSRFKLPWLKSYILNVCT